MSDHSLDKSVLDGYEDRISSSERCTVNTYELPMPWQK